MAIIADYGSNSDKAKAEQKTETTEIVKVRPVELEEAQPAKINWFREFFLGTPKGASNAVVRDVLFPSVKRMLLDAGQSFLSFLFEGSFSKSKSGQRDYSSIRRSSSGVVVETPQKENIMSTSSIFTPYGSETRGPMEVIRDTLLDLLDRQGYVTVRDYYDAGGKSSNNISFDNHYGWTDLSMTEVRYKVFDGLYYIANLPRPRLLDIN